MSLSEKVLKGINDTQPIYSHADRSAAFKAFLGTYEEQTKLDGTLPVLTPNTNGRELKDAVSMLEIDTQLSMLTAYWNTLHGKVIETAAAVEDRKHRHWITKFAIVFVCFTVTLVAGMVITLASKSGKMDSSVITSILSAVGEILKVIVGTSSPTK